MKELLFLILYVALDIATTTLIGGELVEFSFTQRQVYGKYINGDGIHGISFFSGVDDFLLIRTLSDETIVETSPITERDGQKFRAVYIMGREYLQHSSFSHSDQPVDHNTPLSDAIQELMKVEEVGLLKEAAEAVGQKGLTGKDTPAAMPFFAFALRVTQLQTKSDNMFIKNTTRVQRADCLSKCPPCPNNNCFGMCGKGCSCWRWVCGDCCYHTGCYYHDKCCEEQFFQTSCLLPFSFRCDQPYSC